jgi:cytochrome c peroxidase
MKKTIVIAFLVIFCSCLNKFITRTDKNAANTQATDYYLSQPAMDEGIPGHIDQADIEKGLWSVEQLKLAGEQLFLSQFTPADGFGRPGATGNNAPTRRPLGTDVLFTRTAGPDANSCFSCHHSPSVGGAGDFTVNVFSGLGARQPVLFSIDPKLSAERGTPELNGSGIIEMLAREMTMALHQIRNEAQSTAKKERKNIRKQLMAKGVSFGFVTAEPDGTLRLHEVEGIDRDLVVRPWTQKGTVTSLRTFTVNASNLHHGMQASERFGLSLTGSDDFDRDGVRDELTEGDITALVIFQAALNAPGRVLPADKEKQMRINEGALLFKETGCQSCHKPELVLDNPVFSEPGPFNLEGTLRQKEVKKIFFLNLLKDMNKPALYLNENKQAVVRVFTDFKRHRISDSEKPHFGNEDMVEGLTSTDEFITRRLWAVGNTAPYGHRGDIMTLREAILHHGGEAREARLSFEKLSVTTQEKIVEFLKSMQVLPNGAKPVVVKKEEKIHLPYMKKQK